MHLKNWFPFFRQKTESDYYFITCYKRPNVSFVKNPIRSIEEFRDNGYVRAAEDESWAKGKRRKKYLKPGEKPDVTRMAFTSTTEAVKIDYSEPLEHDLIPGPGVTEADVEKMRANRAFSTLYLLDAVKIDYKDAMTSLEPGKKKDFLQGVDRLIQYGVNYAGFPAEEDGTPLVKRKNMFYARNAFDATVVALGPNAALLEESEKKDSGKIWHKTNWNDLISFYQP